MLNLIKLLQTFVSKVVSIVVAIVGLTYTGIKWHQNELEAVENKVIAKVKEYRKEDMDNLKVRLDDIKQDVGIIKKVLMEQRR